MKFSHSKVLADGKWKHSNWGRFVLNASVTQTNSTGISRGFISINHPQKHFCSEAWCLPSHPHVLSFLFIGSWSEGTLIKSAWLMFYLRYLIITEMSCYSCLWEYMLLFKYHMSYEILAWSQMHMEGGRGTYHVRHLRGNKNLQKKAKGTNWGKNKQKYFTRSLCFLPSSVTCNVLASYTGLRA